MKRLFDITWSLIGIITFSPIFLITAILIKLDSSGPIFFKQVRVGKKNKDFKIFKFRTMKVDSDKGGLLTIGNNDNRITKIGFYLRKYKLDELPQLFNVFLGDMSFVGPRPEVRKYVDKYSDYQKEVLKVRPGITDKASIEFRNENDILSKKNNPEDFYINEIMPQKIEINLNYLKKRSLVSDIQVIFKTFGILTK